MPSHFHLLAGLKLRTLLESYHKLDDMVEPLPKQILRSSLHRGDAIKSHLIPEEVTPAQASIIYAEEADVLNVAMFGMTAKQWREANPELKGNIRDYATFHKLTGWGNWLRTNQQLLWGNPTSDGGGPLK